MIICQVESYSDILPELIEMLPVHYEELALNKDHVPLDMDHAKYIELESNNVLLLVTIRKDEKLIGYYFGFITSELHYSSTLSCMTDIFYILPEYRREGAGRILFDTVEEELRNLGVKRWFVSIKNHSKAGAMAMMDRLEFKEIESTYSKWLGGE